MSKVNKIFSSPKQVIRIRILYRKGITNPVDITKKIGYGGNNLALGAFKIREYLKSYPHA